MSRKSDSPEPTESAKQRQYEIWHRLSEAFHIIETDRQAQYKGISPEEHERRHWLFCWAFFIGMEYMATNPQRGARIILDKRRAQDGEAKYVDAIAEHLLSLFPEPQVAKDWPLQLAERMKEPVDTEPVAPAFDDKGRLVWETVDGWPFPWENELEDWSGSTE